MLFTVNPEVGEDERIRVKNKNGRKVIKGGTDRGRRDRSRGRAKVSDIRWGMRVTEGAAYFKEDKNDENGG